MDLDQVPEGVMAEMEEEMEVYTGGARPGQ